MSAARERIDHPVRAALTHAPGYSDFRALTRDNLVALTPEAAEITGLPHESGVRAKTPELRMQLG